MTRQSLTIAFHVGAHKTATTHLQKTIKRATEAIAADGVRFYGPEHFRLPGRTIPALFGFQPGAVADPSRRSPQEQLAALAQDAHRLVISEENFIGPLNSPKGLGLRHRYRPAGERMARLAASFGQDVDVFLAVRRPTTFMNSAYCQMLLGGQVRHLGLYLRRNPLTSVDWLGLVQDLRTTKGIGQITVWRYEDYRVLFPRIVAAMLGEVAARHVPVVDRPINTGLSAAAVAEVLHRGDTADLPDIARRARALLPVADGYPPFDAFTPEDHAKSEQHYANQVAAIGMIPGVTLLRPETS
ncbi:hypothetical protein [Yoonia sp.]|uniref:hypothetical protein n=1 Tax=Yoonia sp. TaxID=2212373 RepID=UPI002FDB83BC